MTVFVAVLHLKGKARKRDIARITGYSMPTIEAACLTLIDAGLAISDDYEFHLVPNSPQLVFDFVLIKNFFPSTSVNLIPKNQLPLNIKTEEEAKINLLKSVGVGEPSRSKIAKAHPIEFIKAHIEYHKKQNEPVSHLVRRLLDGVPVPEDPNSERDRSEYATGKFSDFIEH